MFVERDDGVRIYCETRGSRRDMPLILIHGLGVDHKMFHSQLELYSQQGFFVVAPDMRGHGRSSRVETLQLSDWTGDIAALMEKLNLDSAVLLGVSMGGVIVQKFAVEHPDRAAAIILADTFGELATLGEKLAGLVQVWGFKLFQYLPGELAAKVVAASYEQYGSEVYGYFREVTAEADFDQLVLARKALNRIAIIDELRQVNIPALVLVGDAASIMLEPARKLSEALPNASFQIIEGALDPSNMTGAEQFDEAVAAFLSRLSE